MSIQRQRRTTWATGYVTRGAGDVAGTLTAKYRLNDLINRGLVDTSAARSLLFDAGLVDLAWEVTWAEDYVTLDEELAERIGGAQGYVVFVHGWTGNYTIWESLPGMIVASNRKLVALSLDHNGFGAARFVNETPALETCNPPAAMRVIERLLDVLKLRRQPGDTERRVINFVGHSMGGAALFYLNPMDWRGGEETRYAIAPALLLEDDVHRAFFNALGVGIGLVNRIRAFEVIERAVKPALVETVAHGASDFVQRAHHLVYDETPRGITARTFAAMGMLNNREIPRTWDFFRVMLAHRDALVGLVPMMDLLVSLEFPASNIRVVAGSHYMFSVGHDHTFEHAQARELVVQDILDLHEQAVTRQQKGVRFG